MLPEENHWQYCQNSHFQYGHYEKNSEKWKIGIFVNFNTDKQNLHINVIVENYNEIGL